MPYIGNPIYQSAFVTDQFSGNGSTTAYTMSVAPAGVTNVLVVVSGVVQDPSTYGVVGNTLTFSTAPPSGTGNISCRYLGVPVTGVTSTAYRTKTEFTATAGQTTFTPPSYTVGYIDVFRNGVLLGSADYTASNGTTVVLATGATAGDLITTESFYVSSVLNAISTSGGNITGPLNVSGYLGVGTTSPNTIIHATAAANPVIQVECTAAAGGTAAAYNVIKAATGAGGNSYRAILGGNAAGSYDWAIGNFGSADAQSLSLYAGGITERVRVTSAGNLQFTTSNAGIVFNNSSALTNSTLNDYEAGTWTPSVVANVNFTGVTFSNTRYTKIGNMVTVMGELDGSITNTGLETLVNFTLPFSAYSASWSSSGSYCAYVGTGANRFIPATFFNGSGVANYTVIYMKGSLVSNTGSITGMFTFTYQATF
jgi:hypothetical protein